MPDKPERATPDADRLAGLSDSQLIDEAARYGRKLATMDEGQLIGVAGLLMSAAIVVVAVLLARNSLQAVRGQRHPNLTGTGLLGSDG